MVLQSYKTMLVSQNDYIDKGKVMKFDPSIPFIWFLSDFPDTKKLEIMQQNCSQGRFTQEGRLLSDFPDAKQLDIVQQSITMSI